MKTKICPRCETEQPAIEFRGYKVCRLCHNEDIRIYQAANREKIRERNRIYYYKYRDARLEYMRRYRYGISKMSIVTDLNLKMEDVQFVANTKTNYQKIYV